MVLLRFIADDTTASPEREWLDRVSPFLLADDPHQRCISLARMVGAHDVNQVCVCPAPPCTKECCR